MRKWKVTRQKKWFKCQLSGSACLQKCLALRERISSGTDSDASLRHSHLMSEWLWNTWLCLHTWTATHRHACGCRMMEPCVSQQHTDNRLSAQGHYKLDVVAGWLKIERWSDNGLNFMIINTQVWTRVNLCREMDGAQPPCRHTHTHTLFHMKCI